jgi:AcrR family transcriptional regulator
VSSPAPVADGHRRYAGQTAGERDAARRARLLPVIHEVVGRNGYAAFTVERVCTQANVSTRHFYQLYDGKEAAFADLYDVLLNRAGTRILESLNETRGEPLADRIPAALLAFLVPMLDDLRTARIVLFEVVGLSHRIEATRLRNRENLIALIEAEGRASVARGEVIDRDWRFVALALVATVTTTALDWLLRKDRPPVERLEGQLSELAVSLLASEPRSA